MNARPQHNEYVLITGGAGFIGTNLAKSLATAGHRVVVLDNFSRDGVENNASFLRRHFSQQVEIVRGDCRDSQLIAELVAGATQVFHFAAQVAVTTSLTHPTLDFDVNARGTLVLLEAIRSCPIRPPLVYTSTNKVYGALDDLPLTRRAARYEPLDVNVRDNGISEARPLAFHSPYGCSKGTADQYVIDYAHSYDMNNVVFRMSCIYGPHQCGNEDQGWVAHFVARAVTQQPITIYGDGLQVRDILNVTDLVRAFTLAMERIELIKGRAFNIGGGPSYTVSLLEVVELIKGQTGECVDLRFSDSRRGDQRYFVSDTRLFHSATGWRPVVSATEGVAQLRAWMVHSLATGGSALTQAPAADGESTRILDGRESIDDRSALGSAPRLGRVSEATSWE
ncbi:MAG TPA: SDR family NAD(P)-dependent oxidoreductase [Polyangiaceae bacterium]